MALKQEENSVTILLPCLNEAATLACCIQMAQQALETLHQYGFCGEVLISDNGSTDGSQEIARQNGCRLVSCPDRGYGNAVIYGVDAAKGKYIVMGDADASYDFRESVPMVLKLAKGYDLCMGSRFRGKIMPGAMPWKNRYIGNPVLTGILNLFFHSGLSDAHCGLRAFTKRAFQKMRLSSPGMEFASEMVVKATLLNLKRTETPVTLYLDGRDRPPHLQPWRDGWRHLKFLLMYSPLWLFFVPSALMMLFSSLIFIGLLLTPARQSFTLGQLRFGDHWMILASGIFSIGFQCMILGIASVAYHAQQNFIPIYPFLKKTYKLLTLENTILVSTTFILTGLGIIIYVIFSWSERDFGSLYKIREMIIATTCLMIGLQTCFGGFLLSIIGDIVEDR